MKRIIKPSSVYFRIYEYRISIIINSFGCWIFIVIPNIVIPKLFIVVIRLSVFLLNNISQIEIDRDYEKLEKTDLLFKK